MRKRVNWPIWFLCWQTISFGGLSLALFMAVWMKGRVVLMEPNLTILSIETILATAILVFGFWSLTKAIK